MKQDFDFFEYSEWISPESENPGKNDFRGRFGPPAGYLRRRFNPNKGKKNILYVAVHGIAEIFINGKLLTKDVLFPGPLNYYFETPIGIFDVTPFLREGENEFLAILGNGWYRSYSIPGKLRNFYGEDLSLIAAMFCDDKCVLASDEDFEASIDGPFIGNDLVLGENYDATNEKVSFYKKARVVKLTKDDLILPYSFRHSAIKAHEPVEAKHIGTDLYDFGRYVTGGVTFTIWDAPEGGNVTLTFSDSSDPEKIRAERKRAITYHTRKGTNYYTSHFSIFSMRYVSIESDFDVKYFMLSAIPYYSDIEERLKFKSSNDLITNAVSRCIDAEKGFFTGLFSDGYSSLGEGAGKTIYSGASVLGGISLMTVEDQYDWYLRCVREWQHKSGRIRNLNPPASMPSMRQYEGAQSAGWGDSVIDVAWQLYEFTGDKDILFLNYEMMKRWVLSLEKRAGKKSLSKKVRSSLSRGNNPFEKYLIDSGSPLGDSSDAAPPASERMRRAEKYKDMGTAYLSYSARMMEKTAKLLSKTVPMNDERKIEYLEDMAHFNELAENALLAYRFAFAQKAGLAFMSVDALVRALSLSLLPEEFDGSIITRKAAAERLNEVVSDPMFNLTSLGPLALSNLSETLYEAGFKGTAYRVFLRLCEKEGPLTPEYLTAIGGFLVKHICGISFSEGKITIKPEYCRMMKKCEGIFTAPNGDKLHFGYEFESDGTVKVYKMEQIKKENNKET